MKLFFFFVASHWGEDEPRFVSQATTTMSQRFTVSKSGGDRRPSDIQGQVNQLFEGDEPSACGAAAAAGEAAPAGAEDVVVVLKGRRKPLKKTTKKTNKKLTSFFSTLLVSWWLEH